MQIDGLLKYDVNKIARRHENAEYANKALP